MFGAIFANVLSGRLTDELHGVPIPAGLEGAVNPARLAHLPPHVVTGIVQAYASTIQTVFLVAVPIAAVAFVLTWLLPEIRLRHTVGDAEPGEREPLAAREVQSHAVGGRATPASPGERPRRAR